MSIQQLADEKMYSDFIADTKKDLEGLTPESAMYRIKDSKRIAQLYSERAKAPHLDTKWHALVDDVSTTLRNHKASLAKEANKLREEKRKEEKKKIDKKRKRIVVKKKIGDVFSNGIEYVDPERSGVSEFAKAWIRSGMSDHVLLTICSYLDYECMTNLRLVSRGMHTIAHSLPKCWGISKIVLCDYASGIDASWARKMITFSKYDPSRNREDRKYLHDLETVYLKKHACVGLSKKSKNFAFTDIHLSLASDLLPFYREMMQSYEIEETPSVCMRINTYHYFVDPRPKDFSLYKKHSALLAAVSEMDWPMNALHGIPQNMVKYCTGLKAFKCKAGSCGDVTDTTIKHLVIRVGEDSYGDKVMAMCPGLESIELWYISQSRDNIDYDTTLKTAVKSLDYVKSHYPRYIANVITDLHNQYGDREIKLKVRHASGGAEFEMYSPNGDLYSDRNCRTDPHIRQLHRDMNDSMSDIDSDDISTDGSDAVWQNFSFMSDQDFDEMLANDLNLGADYEALGLEHPFGTSPGPHDIFLVSSDDEDESERKRRKLE